MTSSRLTSNSPPICSSPTQFILLIVLQKIERLKSNLHLIGVSAGNTHTLFVEHADDVAKFDAAAHFDTHEEVLGRAANRPRNCTLHSSVCTGVSKRTVDQVPRPPVACPTVSLCCRSTGSAMHRTFCSRGLVRVLVRPRVVTLLLQLPRTNGQDEKAETAEDCCRGITSSAQLNGACHPHHWQHLSLRSSHRLFVFCRGKARRSKWAGSTSGSRSAKSKHIGGPS